MLSPMCEKWDNVATDHARKHQIQEVGCDDDTHYGDHKPQSVVPQRCKSDGRSAKNKKWYKEQQQTLQADTDRKRSSDKVVR